MSYYQAQLEDGSTPSPPPVVVRTYTDGGQGKGDDERGPEGTQGRATSFFLWNLKTKETSGEVAVGLAVVKM